MVISPVNRKEMMGFGSYDVSLFIYWHFLEIHELKTAQTLNKTFPKWAQLLLLVKAYF